MIKCKSCRQKLNEINFCLDNKIYKTCNNCRDRSKNNRLKKNIKLCLICKQVSKNKKEHCDECVFKVSFKQHQNEQKMLNLIQGKRCSQCKYLKPDNQYQGENKSCEEYESEVTKYIHNNKHEIDVCLVCIEDKEHPTSEGYQKIRDKDKKYLDSISEGDHRIVNFLMQKCCYEEKWEIYEYRIKLKETMKRYKIKNIYEIEEILYKIDFRVSKLIIELLRKNKKINESEYKIIFELMTKIKELYDEYICGISE
ncbi:17037_t:CDS:2 [Funneliformis caledonium]|uniref:17037_t:CDS:1 n=1 Tax=Funneliformis caledonium TaxID=1117310 RepID=A0A9N9EWD9_9GLOM|nr:17037_t:CDS:2 [Funneliformis caledonium]